ncbi:hypothetical protein [Bacteroides sp.]
MRKLLLLFTIVITSSCTSDKRATLFGKYTFEDENEKMVMTLNSDSTGTLTAHVFGIGNETIYFKWNIEDGKMNIKNTQTGKNETAEFTFDGEFFTVNDVKYKKE